MPSGTSNIPLGGRIGTSAIEYGSAPYIAYHNHGGGRQSIKEGFPMIKNIIYVGCALFVLLLICAIISSESRGDFHRNVQDRISPTTASACHPY
jgi:hypothetical protein